MAVPKRRQSRGRKNRRRSHHALTAVGFVVCPSCKKPMRPHHICPNCGYYRGVKRV